MSEKLPGAEYAPIVDIHLPAPFLEEQAAAWRTSLSSIDKSWEELHHKTLTRRLSCTDPDDQRAIWRRAALALGRGAEVALYAVLVRAKGALRTSDGRAMWSLYDWNGHRLAFVWVDEDTVEAATAALCAHVWGPK